MPPKKSFIPRDYDKEQMEYINLCAVNYPLLVDLPNHERYFFRGEDNEEYYWNKNESDFSKNGISTKTYGIVRELQIEYAKRETFEGLKKSIEEDPSKSAYSYNLAFFSSFGGLPAPDFHFGLTITNEIEIYLQEERLEPQFRDLKNVDSSYNVTTNEFRIYLIFNPGYDNLYHDPWLEEANHVQSTNTKKNGEGYSAKN